MKRRFSMGESIASIADSYGITTAAVYATARNYGISIRTCRKTKEAKSARNQKRLKKLREREKIMLKQRKIREAARKARLAEIAEARRSGLSLRAVGAMFNVSNEWVRQSVFQYNETAKRPVPLFRSINKPSPEITERRRKVTELLRAGLSYLEIVKKMKMSQDRIKNDIKVLCKRDPSLPLPNFSTRKCKIDANAKAEILKARKAGQKYQQIAQKYGVTAGRIFNICRDAIDAASKPKNQWKRK
ncbi:MAG: hypothetical protein LBF88_07615 [Planctomycetaceae bacterium]|nr:hypothetical protein [Planctomycetaceae bacterium]